MKEVASKDQRFQDVPRRHKVYGGGLQPTTKEKFSLDLGAFILVIESESLNSKLSGSQSRNSVWVEIREIIDFFHIE